MGREKKGKKEGRERMREEGWRMKEENAKDLQMSPMPLHPNLCPKPVAMGLNIGHLWPFFNKFTPPRPPLENHNVKKLISVLMLVAGLLTGGCSMGLPISPLMLLLMKNDPAPLREGTPNAPVAPQSPATPTVTASDSANVTT
jgi:hypothetical protein